MLPEKIRVVVAKLGLDGHEVGARVIARGLADAGMEVIYTGLRRTPEQVVATALQEDADVIGVSILSGAHGPLLTRIIALLHEQGLDDVLLIAGGIIPDKDAAELIAAGVDGIFHPGTRVSEVADFIRAKVQTQPPPAPPRF